MTMEPTTRDTLGREQSPFVIFALEPYSYAEAIGQTVAALRRHLEVLVVEQRHLPAEGTLWCTAVIFCSIPRPESCHAAIRWVQFSPYEEPKVVRVDGVPHTFPGLGLEDLLWLVDLHTAGSRRG
jgi:hypothetical protein